MTHFAIEYAYSDGARELIEVGGDAGEATFVEACFQAMMASDGYPCALILVVNDKDARRWELAEGHNPDFFEPNILY